MNLTQLNYFRELAAREHLLRTSEALHVSAPTISASLKSLEEELGTPLFDRVGRNIRLNAQGKIFLPYVNELFRQLEEGRQALRQSLAETQQTVSFSLKDMAFFAEFFSMFSGDYPEIRLSHFEGDPDDEGRLIWERDLDLMFTAKDLTANCRLEYMTINADLYVLAVPPGHPLADKGTCSLADLEDALFLNRSANNYFQQCVDRLLAENGFTPQRTMEFDYAARPMILRESQGVMVSTELTLHSPLYRDLRTVYVKEFAGRRYELRAYWRRDKPLSPAAGQMLQAMRDGIEDRRRELLLPVSGESVKREQV